MLNNEDNDYALLAVDVVTKKFILYDCTGAEQPRPKETFLLHVKKIRKFLSDYFKHVIVVDERQQNDDEVQKSLEGLSLEESKQQVLKSQLGLDLVETWKFESGICTKFLASEIS